MCLRRRHIPIEPEAEPSNHSTDSASEADSFSSVPAEPEVTEGSGVEALERQLESLVIQPQLEPECQLLVEFGTRPENLSLSSNTELRFYAVWVIPTDPVYRYSGIHWSISSSAYSSIIGLNRGNFGGIRWRRFESERAAVAGFLREVARHGLPEEFSGRFFLWSSFNASQDRSQGVHPTR